LVDETSHRVERAGTSADDAGVRRRTVWNAAVPVVILSLVACQSGTETSSAAAPGTQVTVFAPFVSETLAADIEVSQTVTGSCWARSAFTSRPDAFRCSYGNYIEDPCFVNTYPIRPREVVCPSSDNPNEVLQIQLTKHPPDTYGGGLAVSTTSPPFWIALTDGTVCTPFAGSAPSIGGLRVNDTCTGAESSLVGDIDRIEAVWTSQATVLDQSDLVTVQLARVFV
jgi:hypothetical protein